MIDQEFIAAWVDRLRRSIPDAAAILLKGSYARGEPGPFSDVDFDVLVDPGPRDDYLTYLVQDDGGQLVHVSVAVQDVESWLSEADEVEDWAYRLTALETTLLLWAREESLRRRLDRPARQHPAGDPELEDFMEAHSKVRNALARGDDLAIRIAAQTLGTLCPSLLRPINPEVQPTHRRAALLAVLDFPVVPKGYRDDLLLCLGLSGRESTLEDVHDAANRLTTGTLSLLRRHAELLQSALPTDLYGYLQDGTLERYIRQREHRP
ncbi:MAG TPA: nucleotidyltransferase domain-containing protein [Thermomicrobiales bacterium]|nr:nucleotidyltransferase domain-containing protein [Thermomicrobiales bacterium]